MSALLNVAAATSKKLPAVEGEIDWGRIVEA